MTFTETDMVCVNNIRTLAADVVDKSNSGHPGMPMGMAPIAHVLWDKVMNFSPTNPKWANRDRFVLSNGHGCTLQYIMLHLAGYDTTIADLQQFRQIGSKTPGHPESFVTKGIEVTTGPLGQGIANAVGLAYAQECMAATYNKPGHDLFNNFTYVFCGDGCLQEGVSGEASSLAGHWGLSKLIVMYDDNGITIDGHTSKSFSEDVPMRYRAYGWHTITVESGDNNLQGILAAIEEAKKVTDKPTLISIKLIIGFGSLLQGTHDCHGAPLGAKDTAQVKEKFGFDPAQKFVVKPEVSKQYGRHTQKGQSLVDAWNATFASYQKAFPQEAAELARRLAGEMPKGWESKLPTFSSKDKPDATRNLSGKLLNIVAEMCPELVGGSADLTPSNKTAIKCAKDFTKVNRSGRYIRFGVREHGMSAIGNGIHAYGGFVPFTATFFNFIEYAYGAVRLAALSGHKHLMIMTHDSIGLGEDGPTHQPIEALALCRATPGMRTFRPADGNETAAAYHNGMTFNGPTVMVLSRQNVTHMDTSSIEKALKGGYVCHHETAGKKIDLCFVSTGTEVQIAIETAKTTLKDLNIRVVSMPCTTLFDEQSTEYRRSVIPAGVPTVAIEALAIQGWEKYSHLCIGMRSYGSSAPIKALYDKYGFTPIKIEATVRDFLAKTASEAAAMGVGGLAALPTHFTYTPVVVAHLMAHL